ncbi:MAG: indole-3-glycerol phosphate synthase TrpC [Desulfuromonadales bacterium]|nr:indole-3-glycerol phosphate synthase TrpC [Desulfuromonadales bacterium]
MNTPDILRQIIEYKKEELAESSSAMPLTTLKSKLSDREDKPRGFEAALRNAAESGWRAIIAEVKKGSPSKGVIREDFDPVEIAAEYEKSGATCLSVLTEQKFFMGHLRFISLIKEQVGLPILRKDFIMDQYQIYESYVSGSDAILLIAAMLEPSQLADFAGFAKELQLDVLLEVHDHKEMEIALSTDCSLIGINNRNLRTFVTDLAVTEELAQMVPADRLIVAESGINTAADIRRLQDAGARAFLIGEALMRDDDIAVRLGELLSI